jgi:hypothetical protein
MTFLDKAKEVVGSFMSISLGLRIAIGVLLGALGSSTLIGFLAELGAVNYALAYGARLPTEGVPYLRYAATAISLSLFVIAFAVLLIVNLIILGSIRQFLATPPISEQADKDSIASIPIRQYILIGAIPAFAATQGLTSIFALLAPIKTLPQWVFFAFSSIATMLILVLARKPTWAKRLILSVFILTIGVFFVTAFTPSLYGKALLFARQGGGVDVRLEMNCDGKTPCDPLVVGKLFLRTTESFVVRDEKTQEVRESPSRLVESVRYLGEERWGTR